MEKDKSRGLKHIKDKRKYKGNTTKNPKYVPPKTLQPNLGSNWERYEPPEEPQGTLNSNTDFKLLDEAPITTGSHFQFKNESVEEPLELFALNLQVLHRNVLTVPFYARLGIPKGYFDDDEVVRQQKNAQAALVSYKQRVKSGKDVTEELTEKYQRILMVGDEASEMKVEKKCEGGDEGDLEDWLDDILSS